MTKCVKQKVKRWCFSRFPERFIKTCAIKISDFSLLYEGKNKPEFIYSTQ